MSDLMQFDLECQNCGHTEISIPDEATHDSIAVCASCGVELARWGDIKQKCMEMAKDEVSAMFKDAFKGLKG